MMQLKTSSKISLKFTFFTLMLVLLFGFVANVLFFRGWYNSSIMHIKEFQLKPVVQKKIMWRLRWRLIEQVPVSSADGCLLMDGKWISNLSQINDKYFLFVKNQKVLMFMDVTYHVELQKNLIWNTLYLFVIFGLLAYVLSLFFVKSSLRSLQDLVEFAQNLHFDHLDQKIELPGPDDDEIKIVAQTLNISLQKIHNQAVALKSFVTNVSHEFRTPLMAMSTEIDYALKSHKYVDSFGNLKLWLWALHSLLEDLLMVAQRDAENTLKKTRHNIVPVLTKNTDLLKKKYADKKIILKLWFPDKMMWNCNLNAVEMIYKNLLENALKYSSPGTCVEVRLTQNALIVKDEGKWIAADKIDKIWDKFWKDDSARTGVDSFGLGLSLVKRLVELSGWEIFVESVEWEGSQFELKVIDSTK